MIGIIILFLACGFVAFVWSALAPGRPRTKGLIVGSLPAAALAAVDLSALADPMGLFFILIGLWVPGAAGGVAGAHLARRFARGAAAEGEPPEPPGR